MCDINIHRYRNLHQFTSAPSHPAGFYFVSAVCWQSNGNKQQQEQKFNLPTLSAKTRTHTHTHSCLCVRCCPLNQLCDSSALLGSFFSLFLSLSFCSVITSVAEQETVNARCLFTSLSFSRCSCVSLICRFISFCRQQREFLVGVWVYTCVRIDLIMHMTDNLFM